MFIQSQFLEGNLTLETFDSILIFSFTETKSIVKVYNSCKNWYPFPINLLTNDLVTILMIQLFYSMCVNRNTLILGHLILACNLLLTRENVYGKLNKIYKLYTVLYWQLLHKHILRLLMINTLELKISDRVHDARLKILLHSDRMSYCFHKYINK